MRTHTWYRIASKCFKFTMILITFYKQKCIFSCTVQRSTCHRQFIAPLTAYDTVHNTTHTTTTERTEPLLKPWQKATFEFATCQLPPRLPVAACVKPQSTACEGHGRRASVSEHRAAAQCVQSATIAAARAARAAAGEALARTLQLSTRRTMR